ncbi:hypothetical protein SN16_04060 [Salinicoccus roseus]|uniref:Uncharacterized protein n=1 Tax=Salinicoccus roseus TaxID=45670 RepID=A0A0C2E7E3_9STAP|nr:hypothetical protein SN16_04060 [Salinicoccus roseus]
MLNSKRNKNSKLENIHAANVAEDHIQSFANSSSAVYVSVNLLTKVRFLALKKQAGNRHKLKGGN